MRRSNQQVLEVWGDLACFSQPPLSVERFTYPVITPSAARGIFDAIYVKPSKFRWQIREVELFERPRYIALRRNEMKQKTPGTDTLWRWMEGREEPEPLYADTDDEAKGRTQRQTIALKNVRYRLHAEIRPWPGYENELAAFEAQFRRRAEQGQCAWQPYLGMREFAAYFRLVEEADRATPIPFDMEVGWMLYDVFDLSRPGTSEDKPFITLFHARIEGGRLRVPPFESPEVKKPIPGG
jgi:CRISPR-associated protein Cas5d